jgi:hypothetical protein
MIRWFFLGVFTIAVGVVLFLQHETTANLRNEIELLREDQRELAQLRQERERLLAAQPPAAELERLRADRAALAQLRTEIDAMKSRADGSARTVSAVAAQPAPANRAPASGAREYTIALRSDGGLRLEGRSVALANIRQQLAQVPRDIPVEIRIVMDTDVKPDDLKATAEGLSEVGKELGLKLKFRFEQP